MHYQSFETKHETSISNIPWSEQLSSKTTYEEIAARAAEMPEKPAISFQLTSGVNDNAKTLNWQDFRARVAQCANALRDLGIEETDTVAYLLPNCLEAVVINQGGATAGIVNPINPLISADHIAGVLNETGAKILVTLAPLPKTEVAQLAAEVTAMVPTIKTILTIDLVHYITGIKKYIAPLIRPKVKWPEGIDVLDFNEVLDQYSTELTFELSKEDRPAAYFHTGGTTGRPKVAQHFQSGMLYNGWLGREMIVIDDDVFICPLPMFHVFAAYPILMSCIMRGAHMVMITPQGYRGDGVFDNFWKLIERWKVSLLIMVPTAATQLMQRKIDADVSTLRYAVCGSAPLPLGLFKRFEETTGVRILEGYGMTEATCLVSVNPLTGERRVGSVGYPLPYTDIEILDCDKEGNVLKECQVGEIGEICIRNPGVVIGGTYLGDTTNEGQFAKESFFRTGDLGKFDEEGFLWITGRAKDLIIRGGHNIDPAMIEEALAEHEDVAFAGAIGQPDNYSGEVPCAYVELTANATLTVDELMAYAEDNIAERAAMPKHIEIMAELPKTAVGKVFKPELRRMAITRVLNESFEEASIACQVAEVTENKERGLVAHLQKTGECAEADIQKFMGEYSIKWEIQ